MSFLVCFLHLLCITNKKCQFRVPSKLSIIRETELVGGSFFPCAPPLWDDLADNGGREENLSRQLFLASRLRIFSTGRSSSLINRWRRRICRLLMEEPFCIPRRVFCGITSVGGRWTVSFSINLMLGNLRPLLTHTRPYKQPLQHYILESRPQRRHE